MPGRSFHRPGGRRPGARSDRTRQHTIRNRSPGDLPTKIYPDGSWPRRSCGTRNRVSPGPTSTHHQPRTKLTPSHPSLARKFGPRRHLSAQPAKHAWKKAPMEAPSTTRSIGRKRPRALFQGNCQPSSGTERSNSHPVLTPNGYVPEPELAWLIGPRGKLIVVPSARCEFPATSRRKTRCTCRRQRSTGGSCALGPAILPCALHPAPEQPGNPAVIRAQRRSLFRRPQPASLR